MNLRVGSPLISYLIAAYVPGQTGKSLKEKRFSGYGRSANFLSGITNSAVVVKLHSGITYKGTLQSIDGYMNIVLEGRDVQECVGKDSKVVNSFKNDVFIRGNNVLYIGID
ncbi:hypothetical protein BABINDRAFT_13976 [Babjeviella inositovora NRRL Y-12698]|uniref:Sm domain-containing protein n=1 Tax=Babjeviella inositovora NRRL Y-12698 TaxID=984486 RepID=A0A1E3QPG0_9ASCO|nr:uncharacterized protein BABINDRAFT_13976 [Babjeviella inositovora NRRL Y-12698]ODQ78952.1 hypothetical protein BABINDRAFT_13976 [Babjeviella inositovora NRRL Y-12698]